MDTSAVNSSSPMSASADRRFVAYVIDILIAWALTSLLGAGNKSSPIMWVGVAFLFLKDLGGASPGKLILGIRVVRRDAPNRPAGIARRLGRNLAIALATARAVPSPTGVAWEFEALTLIAAVALAFDGGHLWDAGERLSDRIFGTAVVRRGSRDRD
jgi:uncharacterized RDD family membrane protein YckC